MLNKTDFFALNIRRKAERIGHKGEQENTLKCTFRQLNCDEEEEYTVGFILNLHQRKVLDKVGNLQNTDKHFT